MPLTMWSCVLSYNRRIISVKTGLFFQEITFITKFPGSNFLLPTFLTGSKQDFQVANLLLATVHFEHCLPSRLHLFCVELTEIIPNYHQILFLSTALITVLYN